MVLPPHGTAAVLVVAPLDVATALFGVAVVPLAAVVAPGFFVVGSPFGASNL